MIKQQTGHTGPTGWSTTIKKVYNLMQSNAGTHQVQQMHNNEKFNRKKEKKLIIATTRWLHGSNR